MWNLPRPGIERASLTLAGEFLTTGPPGKSASIFKSLSYLVDIEVSGLHSPYPIFHLERTLRQLSLYVHLSIGGRSAFGERNTSTFSVCPVAQESALSGAPSLRWSGGQAGPVGEVLEGTAGLWVQSSLLLGEFWQ